MRVLVGGGVADVTPLLPRCPRTNQFASESGLNEVIITVYGVNKSRKNCFNASQPTEACSSRLLAWIEILGSHRTLGHGQPPV